MEVDESHWTCLKQLSRFQIQKCHQRKGHSLSIWAIFCYADFKGNTPLKLVITWSKFSQFNRDWLKIPWLSLFNRSLDWLLSVSGCWRRWFPHPPCGSFTPVHRDISSVLSVGVQWPALLWEKCFTQYFFFTATMQWCKTGTAETGHFTLSCGGTALV